MSETWRLTWARVALAVFGVAWGAGQFAPLLLVYRDDVHLASGTISALWIIYVVGLIPAMLLAGYVSDRVGRRGLVRLALVLSLLSSLSMLAGSVALPLLFLGRLLAGLASGAAFGPATAWIKEASVDASDAVAARRAAIALSLGFGGGPMFSGAVAAWLPLPDALPFALHVAVLLPIIPYAWGSPEPEHASDGNGTTSGADIAAALRRPEFLRNVLPTAPWVFGTVAIASAVLPELVVHGGSSPALAGVVSATSLGAGVLVQPLGKRVEARHPGKSMHAGLLLTALGCGAGVLTVALDAPALLVPSAVVLGAAYGMVLVAGLVQIEALAQPRDLASLTAGFYCLTYVGFSAPVVFTLAENLVSDTTLLVAAAVVALLTIPILTPRRPDRVGDPHPAGARRECGATA